MDAELKHKKMLAGKRHLSSNATVTQKRYDSIARTLIGPISNMLTSMGQEHIKMQHKRFLCKLPEYV